MRQEFNLKNMPLKALAEAALLALPAITATALQQGWEGLGLATASVACASYKLKRRMEGDNTLFLFDADKTKSLFEENGGASDPSIKLQVFSDELTTALGMRRAEIRMTDKVEVAERRGHVIRVNPDSGKRLHDNELKFIITHELDHIFNKDHKYTIPFQFARYFNAAATGLSAVNVMCGNILGSPASSVSSILTYGALTHVSLSLASNRISRAKEFRADSNAVRITNDAASGISALEKTHESEKKNERAWSRTFLYCYHLLINHPSQGARVENITRTAREMAQEKLNPPTL